MEKGEKNLLIFLSALAGATFFAVIILTILAYQIGVEKLEADNKSVIIGGLFSLGGGAIGALSAYLIARMQLTKQLELQDEKDRKRILLEIKMKKAEEVLEILYQTRSIYFELQGSWAGYLLDQNNYMKNCVRNKEEVNYDDFLNKGLIGQLELHRDRFINKYGECYIYKSYFKDLITNIEECHTEYFKDLTLNINGVLMHFSGTNYRYTNYIDMYRDIKYLIKEVDDRFDLVYTKILEHIKSFEEELQEQYNNFENSNNN
ncbi:hypothetical protein B1B04_18850 [Lysinibacillus sp. KCTC 33748]|uniref:hypothetical protein n=1 Tax=unclassified Lysinibacillus TaxID=2636778 RepID=UPI0009A8E95C|nr:MULTISPECIES: hypothetical protein [unclassified Lysinibacillus]OXS70223.1 hypothetical protein B1B04_18850 [Lysinibacillus sp. KCTC 33748]SKC04871.1 hypothetical protein SAMN06295926_11959 [Lysinibacillus sp. AC-3]